MTDWLGMIPTPKTPRPELREQVLARAMRPTRRPAWRLAAAAMLAIAVGGGGAWWAGDTIAGLRAEVAALRDSLGFVHSPTTRVTWIPVTTGGKVGAVTIFADSATRRWLVRCEGMAPNEPDETYQIWFITEDGAKSAALMTMAADETTVMTMGLAFPADAERVVGAAMSIEPRSGSPQPRGPIVFRVRI